MIFDNFEQITNKKYDYLVVGSGLFGSIFAYEASKRNKKVLVVEKRNHVGGNVYTENKEGIIVHTYGPHIFHTDEKYIWDYVNSFGEFNNFINSPIANYKGEIYNLPFNMNTFVKLWPDVKTPQDAYNKIEHEKKMCNSKIDEPKNLEEQAISLVGYTIYRKLIRGYTEKQWGDKCINLPPSIIKRIPVRFMFNNNYFNDKYQGVPVRGYTPIINKMLNDADVLLNCDYLEHKDLLNSCCDKIIYTGQIDAFYDYQYGTLEYRSLDFDTVELELVNYQGNAVVNYTSNDVPYTRVIEHKWFNKKEVINRTIITFEYPKNYDKDKGDIPFYPVNTNKNNEIYEKYLKLAYSQDKVIFCGRLGEYKYYNMDKIVERALTLSNQLLGE